MAHSTNVATNGRASVVLLGHSYINRLQFHAHRSARTFQFSDIDIHYICEGGLTLRPRSTRSRHNFRRRYCSIRDCIQDVVACAPSAVIVHIGENDLKCMPAREIISEILLLHTDLTHFCNCRVYITQLLTWPSHSPATISDITEINCHLRRTLPKYQFYCHRRSFTAGVKCSVMYNPDRAHLNHTGMSQYFSSIRALVARAVRHIC